MGLFNGIRRALRGRGWSPIYRLPEGHRMVALLRAVGAPHTHDDLRGEPIYLDLEIMRANPSARGAGQSKLKSAWRRYLPTVSLD